MPVRGTEYLDDEFEEELRNVERIKHRPRRKDEDKPELKPRPPKKRHEDD